jgi:hypothetical protein
VLNIDTNGFGDNTDVFTVPEGHYFFIGDNRDNSQDSRYGQAVGGVGFVPADHLIGRADRIMFSSAGRSMLYFWTWRRPLLQGGGVRGVKISADLQDFQGRIGAPLSPPDLLVRALTHASIAPTRPTNERLEFLGDRVLGLSMAEALFRRPGRRRGQACAALQRAGAAGNLRRGRARGRAGRGAEAGPVRDAVGRAPQGCAAGRRDGGGDRRGLSGRGL